MSGSDSPTFFHGQPWSSWIEKIGRDKPLSDDEPDAEPASSVMRLSVDDIDLYGFCPERDTFYGVVCEICNSIVKPQALIQHMESRHPSGTTSFPPPSNSTAKLPMKTPYCKLSKLKKSQSTGQISIANNGNSNNNSNSGNNITINSKTSNNHTPVKQRTSEQQPPLQQPNLHTGTSPRSPLESGINSNSNGNNSNSSGVTNLPPGQMATAGTTSGFANAIGGGGGGGSGTSPVKSPGNQPKRKRLKTERSLLKDREYDPDRHCGVWNEETGKPCTRSLTCKAHTVSLRRTVAGRSKSFDKLLADHRAAKESPSSTSGSTGTRNSQAKVTGSSGNSNVATAAVAVAAASTASTVAVEPVSASSAPLVAVTLPEANPSAAAVAIGSSIPELEAPSSPPVLSLPDTYPLPQAVDLLYRCLAPHGSNKPTKLEEDFVNELDATRRIEPSMVNSSVSSASTNNSVTAINSSINNPNAGNINAATNNGSSSSSSNAAIPPMTVVLPSLSPISGASGNAAGAMSPQTSLLQQYSRGAVEASSPIGMEHLMGKQQSPTSAPLVHSQMLPVVGSQSSIPPVVAALEAKTAPLDLDSSTAGMYGSPVYKDSGSPAVKSSHVNNLRSSLAASQSPISSRSSFSSLFDASLEQQQQHSSAIETRSHALTNGKRSGSHHLQQQQQLHHHHQFSSFQSQLGRVKNEFAPDYSTTSIQLEATATSTPYATFDEITWSSHHPEPLAVSKWLRITSSRKQFNFNIH